MIKKPVATIPVIAKCWDCKHVAKWLLTAGYCPYKGAKVKKRDAICEAFRRRESEGKYDA